jgi:hypothetical protein
MSQTLIAGNYLPIARACRTEQPQEEKRQWRRTACRF